MVTEQLQEFWADVTDVWQNGLMGINISQLVIAAGIFLGFVLIKGIFTKYVIKRLQNWSRGTQTRIDDKIVDALAPPIRFVPIVLGVFFAGQSLEVGDGFNDFLSQLNRSLIAFTMFWAMYRATVPLSSGFKPLEKLLSPLMVNWLFRVARALVLFLGGAIILEIWGIEVAPLLAGLGLFGAAVALGAQDLFKNLIGGVTVIAEKRFEPGEWIRVDGVVEGIVEDINFRSTLVRRFDKAPVHVPNADLSDAVVTNFSRMTHRRIKWYVGVTYDTTVDQLRRIRDGIAEHIEQNDNFASADEVSTFVRIDRFDDSAITLMIYCFTKTTKWGEWLKIKEDLAYTIKDIVEGVGTSFAFPSQSIYVESLPDDTAEIFSPSQKKSPKSKKAA